MSNKVISTDGPSVEEKVQNEPLSDWCATRREPEEESDRRRSVLYRLQVITKAWIRSIMISEFRMSPEMANQVDCRLFTTGSYRYNVHTTGSDIDIVLVAPDRVTRDRHFFGLLVDRLKSEPWIGQMDLVKDAKNPLIAMKADGIDIDLQFACIREPTVPEIITDRLMKNLDEASVRACNAVRVASAIIDLVPNKAEFRQALRFVKAWGKNRAIYSFKLGFPSGIGWAILVARACQNFPNKNAAGVLHRFFKVYKDWFQPDPTAQRPNRAVFLTETMIQTSNELGDGWNPRNPVDGMARFPVLTPAQPYQNTCHTVSLTTLRVLCKEFKRGFDILDSYMATPPQQCEEKFGKFGVWNHVIEKYPLFVNHTFFLVVAVSCSDAKMYSAWVDSVEPKIAMLWATNRYTMDIALEAFPQLEIRPFSDRLENPEEVALREAKTVLPAGKDYTAYFVAGVDIKSSTSKLDLTKIVVAFQDMCKKISTFSPPATKVPVVKFMKRGDLPAWMGAGKESEKRAREGDETAASVVAPPPPSNPSVGPADATAGAPPVGTPTPLATAAPSASTTKVVVPTKPTAPPPPSMLDEALGMDF